MDIHYFLKRQLDFIRQFYETSSAPFIERGRLISYGEEPFIPPPSYNPEDGEPYFLQELYEVDESLQILGYACVSMLSNLLKVYFQEWERLRIGKYDKKDCDINKAFKDGGFLNGYKAYFAQCKVNFDDSPAKLEVLEQLILVRNKTQHMRSISWNIPWSTSTYSIDELKKLSPSFFMDDYIASRLPNIIAEADEGSDAAAELHLLSLSPITITGEKLFAAISEIEAFTEWLENSWNARER